MYEHDNIIHSLVSTVDWDQRFCRTDWCAAVLWVRRDPLHRELWHVRTRGDDTAYTVAATYPVCPDCGGDLLTVANLSDGVE